MNDLTKPADLTIAVLPAPGGCYTSLDRATPAGRLAVYRAIVGSDFMLDDLVGDQIDVEHIMIHWVEDKGEQSREGGMRPRGVLISPDGTRISTGSETALRCVLTAAALSCSPAPWKPALHFRVLAEKRKEGPGHWLNLEWMLVGEAKG